jgi:hypothetical protein
MYQVIDAFFSMTMDVYKQVDVQDENTGNIKKEWHFNFKQRRKYGSVW